jgi:hypothetical protein
MTDGDSKIAEQDGAHDQLEGVGKPFSETVSKKRRGRPRVLELDPAQEARMHGLYDRPDQCRRSYVNFKYEVASLRALRPEGQDDGPPDPRYAWFAGARRNWRRGVLTELDRVVYQFGVPIARMFADRLAERVADGDIRTTRAAVAWVREVRFMLMAQARRNQAA